MPKTAALRAAIFGQSGKNRRGVLNNPPSRAKVKQQHVSLSESETAARQSILESETAAGQSELESETAAGQSELESETEAGQSESESETAARQSGPQPESKAGYCHGLSRSLSDSFP